MRSVIFWACLIAGSVCINLAFMGRGLWLSTVGGLLFSLAIYIGPT